MYCQYSLEWVNWFNACIMVIYYSMHVIIIPVVVIYFHVHLIFTQFCCWVHCTIIFMFFIITLYWIFFTLLIPCLFIFNKKILLLVENDCSAPSTVSSPWLRLLGVQLANWRRLLNNPNQCYKIVYTCTWHYLSCYSAIPDTTADTTRCQLSRYWCTVDAHWSAVPRTAEVQDGTPIK
jgi:hypothetical protein